MYENLNLLYQFIWPNHGFYLKTVFDFINTLVMEDFINTFNKAKHNINISQKSLTIYVHWRVNY